VESFIASVLLGGLFTAALGFVLWPDRTRPALQARHHAPPVYQAAPRPIALTKLERVVLVSALVIAGIGGLGLVASFALLFVMPPFGIVVGICSVLVCMTAVSTVRPIQRKLDRIHGRAP